MKAISSLILGLSILLAFPLHASEESHREAAKQMVEVANLDKMLTAMYQQINAVITQNLLAKDPCLAPIKEPLQALLTKYDQKILNADVVKAEIQKVYQTEFSEDEIKQIVAFYKTPAGKKALEKAPVLAAKGMEIAQKEIDKNKNAGVMDELQKEINNLINNIDVNKLSPECKKKFEDRKQQAKAETKTDQGAKTGVGAAGAAASAAAGAAAAGATTAESSKTSNDNKTAAAADAKKTDTKTDAKANGNGKAKAKANGNGKAKKNGKNNKDKK
jgi:hypothetical protein